MPIARVYLSPGMFGFARLASFDYFEHVERALLERFHARGRAAQVHIVDVHPTASICRRAEKLARTIASTCGDEGPIHIVGHSTGGLDARLIASPSAHVPGVARAQLAFLPRLRTITTLNTPHYGTPLAAFFATVSGQRLLYAISAITVTALKLGAPPLGAASALVAAFGRLSIGNFELDMVNRMVDAVTRVLDEASSRELHAWLDLLRGDQGAIVQLMPEAMDLFQAGVEDRPGVRYQCIATYAPQNAVMDWLSALRSPWTAMSAAIFTALYNVTARHDERYPCSAHDGASTRELTRMLGEAPPPTANDGVVPLASQIWGDVLWVGKADHLDIVGHFPGSGGHTDWLASGSRFSRVRFDVVMDRIVNGMIVGEELHDTRAPISERRRAEALPPS